MYDPKTLAERILNAMDGKFKSEKELLISAGLNTSVLDNMKKKKPSMPSAEKVAMIADALNCSIDYLLGRTDNPELHKAFLLQDDEALLLDRYSQLDDLRKEILRGWAGELVLNIHRGSGDMENKKPASDQADAG